jgi:hypothetical protein
MIEVNCAHCRKTFDKSAAEVKRQRKNRPNHNFYCSKECRALFQKVEPQRFLRECNWCEKPFETLSKERGCCSKSCSAKLSQSHATEETRQKQSIAGRLNFEKGLYPVLTLNLQTGEKKGMPPFQSDCKICGAKIETPRKKGKAKITCSDKCYRELVSKNSRSNSNCGGRTNYKKFQYKEHWMDSSWEVKVAEVLDEKQIKWNRTKKTHFKWTDKSGKRRRYHPDFYLPDYDLYLEPKNKFLQEKDKFKIEQVIKDYGITLVVGDLKKILSFVTNLEQ